MTAEAEADGGGASRGPGGEGGEGGEGGAAGGPNEMNGPSAGALEGDAGPALARRESRLLRDIVQ